MTLLGALLLVLSVTSGTVLVLAALVVARKRGRDRSERRSRARRGRYAHVLGTRARGPLELLVREVVRDPAAQADLLAELGTGAGPDAERCRRLLDEARELGLIGALVGRLGHRDPVVRGGCALLLARLRVPGAPRHLRGLLADPDPDVRLVACAGLALTEDPEAARALIRALGEGRLTPERLIERLAAPWAVPTMLELLPDQPPGVRAHLARALGLAGDPAAAPALVGLLLAGATEERTGAARALGAVGGPGAAAPLIDALADPAWPVRVQAARALGRLGAVAAAPALRGLLTDAAWWARAAAAEALAALGPAGHRELRLALDSEDPFARDRAREQLARIALSGGQDAHTAALAA